MSDLDAAIAIAKQAAGLDPERLYPPVEWIDFLPTELHTEFWARQVDRWFQQQLGPEVG